MKNYSYEIFLNRWIGRRRPIEWPARLPDLDLLDFLLGYLKANVFVIRPSSINYLKKWLRIECRTINEKMGSDVSNYFQDGIYLSLSVH